MLYDHFLDNPLILTNEYVLSAENAVPFSTHRCLLSPIHQSLRKCQEQLFIHASIYSKNYIHISINSAAPLPPSIYALSNMRTYITSKMNTFSVVVFFFTSNSYIGIINLNATLLLHSMSPHEKNPFSIIKTIKS